VLALPAAALAAPVAAKPIAGTNGATVPKLVWRRCAAAPPEGQEGLDYQCSVARVPLSYRDPKGLKCQPPAGPLQSPKIMPTSARTATLTLFARAPTAIVR